jgi:hypothetical protein
MGDLKTFERTSALRRSDTTEENSHAVDLTAKCTFCSQQVVGDEVGLFRMENQVQQCTHSELPGTVLSKASPESFRLTQSAGDLS